MTEPPLPLPLPPMNFAKKAPGQQRGYKERILNGYKQLDAEMGLNSALSKKSKADSNIVKPCFSSRVVEI